MLNSGPMFKMVETVTPGHPDKICDQIADAILDEYLRRDPQTRADIEVFGSHGMIAVGGTVASKADFDCSSIVRRVYESIVGHNDVEPFVNVGADTSEDGCRWNETTIVHGYATRETREFLPRPYVIAQHLVRKLDQLRVNDPAFFWMKPHAKVTVVSSKHKITQVTILLDHASDIPANEVLRLCLERVIEPIMGDISGLEVRVNPYGAFRGGEFVTGSGSTGRKTAQDTYGGLIPHGVSAICGKSPCLPDRSGVYMARFVAKDLVRSGVADNVLVNVGYTGGREEPTFLQAQSGDGKNLSGLLGVYDFRPSAIIERLDLRRPIYQRTASYGHFGDEQFPWERRETLQMTGVEGTTAMVDSVAGPVTSHPHSTSSPARKAAGVRWGTPASCHPL